MRNWHYKFNLNRMRYSRKMMGWALGLVVLAGVISWFIYHKESSPKADTGKSGSKSVTFVCADDGSIQADFDDHSVNLQLSDGRNLMLKRAVSGSGARYTNDEENIVFWNKGNTAFIKEQDSTTYQNCVVKGQDDLANFNNYKKADIRFRYPRVLQLYRESISDTSGWSYASVQKGDLIVQLKFASTAQPKTNLAEATFTVGKSDAAKAIKKCGDKPQGITIKTDSVRRGGVTYMKNQYGDAGAGNFYQIRQFRTLHQNNCYSIEEMVHSTNIHNYPPERGISEFDSARVWKALDAAWQTFNFTR